MALGNQYWELLNITDNNPEYKLYESLIEEFTQISGWPIYYYVKLESDVVDDIYGEDPNEEFTQAYETKLVYEPTEETDVLNSFGISSDDTIQYMQIPKSMFLSDIQEKYQDDHGLDEEIKPKVGDCIRTLWNNKIYEIADVGSEQKIFQGRKLIWEFVVRPYRHSEESASADEMLVEVPPDEDFPEDNVTTTTTAELSAYGDNEKIDSQSDYDSDADTSIYGF